LDGKTALADALPELERLTTGTLVDGYWHGQPGIEAVKEEYYGVA
jgi:putative protease